VDSPPSAVVDGRMVAGMDDVADLFTQPPCPECATVLRDSPPGFVCGCCGLLFLRSELPVLVA
jgi:hypothetical protein